MRSSPSLSLGEKYKSTAHMVLIAFVKQISTLSQGLPKPNCEMVFSFMQQPNHKSFSLQIAQPTLFTLFIRKSPFVNLSSYRSPLHPAPALSQGLNSTKILQTNCFISLLNSADETLQLDPTEDSPTRQTHIPIPNSQLSTQHITPPSAKRKKNSKKNMLPSRRSKRLQAKQRPPSTKNACTSRKTAQTKAISFNLGSLETPLDNDTTVAVLQATGLEINDQVHLLIQEALSKDQSEDGATSSSQNSQPSTPLHDTIPPRTIPESDLPL